MIEKPHLVMYPSVVTKLFEKNQDYLAELRVYESNAPHVPKLLSHGKARTLDDYLWYITTNRVKGKAYMDESDFSPALLGKALAEFHFSSLKDGKCLCHMDNQPKNILFDGAEYYFVDFSDSKYDTPETDVSHLLLFWAEEYPYMDFIRIAGCMLNSYQQLLSLKPDRWEKTMPKSIKRFDARRTMFNKRQASEHSEKNRNWLSAVI